MHDALPLCIKKEVCILTHLLDTLEVLTLASSMQLPQHYLYQKREFLLPSCVECLLSLPTYESVFTYKTNGTLILKISA